MLGEMGLTAAAAGAGRITISGARTTTRIGVHDGAATARRPIGGVDPATLVQSHELGGCAFAGNIESMADNMRAGGFVGPPIDVIVDRGRMVIVDGHRGTMAAGRTQTPMTIRTLDADASPISPGGWRSVEEVVDGTLMRGANTFPRPRRGL